MKTTYLSILTLPLLALSSLAKAEEGISHHTAVTSSLAAASAGAMAVAGYAGSRAEAHETRAISAREWAKHQQDHLNRLATSGAEIKLFDKYRSAGLVGNTTYSGWQLEQALKSGSATPAELEAAIKALSAAPTTDGKIHVEIRTLEPHRPLSGGSPASRYLSWERKALVGTPSEVARQIRMIAHAHPITAISRFAEGAELKAIQAARLASPEARELRANKNAALAYEADKKARIPRLKRVAKAGAIASGVGVIATAAYGAFVSDSSEKPASLGQASLGEELSSPKGSAQAK